MMMIITDFFIQNKNDPHFAEEGGTVPKTERGDGALLTPRFEFPFSD